MCIRDRDIRDVDVLFQIQSMSAFLIPAPQPYALDLIQIQYSLRLIDAVLFHKGQRLFHGGVRRHLGDHVAVIALFAVIGIVPPFQDRYRRLMLQLLHGEIQSLFPQNLGQRSRLLLLPHKAGVIPFACLLYTSRCV